MYSSYLCEFSCVRMRSIHCSFTDNNKKWKTKRFRSHAPSLSRTIPSHLYARSIIIKWKLIRWVIRCYFSDISSCYLQLNIENRTTGMYKYDNHPLLGGWFVWHPLSIYVCNVRVYMSARWMGLRAGDAEKKKPISSPTFFAPTPGPGATGCITGVQDL